MSNQINPPENADQPQRRPELRSKTSTKHAYIRFINMTHRRVDVIWINYEGVRVKYKTLEAGEYFDVTSFVNHPWIFRDAETHTKLVVSSKEVFDVPEPVYLKLQNGRVQATRAIVAITTPLYSLHEWAIQAVLKNLREPADVNDLDIPNSLKQELRARCCYTIPMLQYTRRTNNN
ncbi:Von Hippel-Lindau disease tumor suppressor [Orchesella cincta]|uniref:von Hippel-Lindau disease tumor suppressor n=1 Tax=Orchesella cincta TaxID=48709 RepID=A0A1D2NCB0_ORCCI|nr:Von Hippel-Lindau disease tumor suppressor [Orchesella cincta]